MSLLNWIGAKIGLRSTEFWRAYYGTDTWAGEVVSSDTAMQVAAFWACVRLIASTIGTLPVNIYERMPDGDRKLRDDLPLFKVVHFSPNADQTAVTFWEGMALAICLGGNAFAEKFINGAGELVSLHPLPFNCVLVERTTNGTLQYRYSDPLRNGQVRIIPEANMMHVRGFGLGGDLGLSPIAFARQTLGAARGAERASAAIFANGMRPSGWLVYKGGVLSPEQRDQAKKTLIDPMQGAGNTGKTGILEADFDYKQITIAPEAAQMLESRAFSVEEVCRWYGVPPVLVGHASAGQTMWGSGVEQIMIGWLTLGLRPYLSRFEQAVARSCIPPEQRQQFYAEFSTDSLLRGDSAAQAALFSVLAQNGIMSRDEIRAKMSLPKVPGGEVLTVQVNLTPLDKLGQQPTAAAAPVAPATGAPVPAGGTQPAGDQPVPPPQRAALRAWLDKMDDDERRPRLAVVR